MNSQPRNDEGSPGTHCYANLSDRELDIVRVAFLRLTEVIERMPAPNGIEGADLSARDLEMIALGVESVPEALRELILEVVMSRIERERIVEYDADA